MSDYKLNKSERIDVEEILKDLEHYHPRRRGWTWRTPAPAEQLKQGPCSPAWYPEQHEEVKF